MIDIIIFAFAVVVGVIAMKANDRVKNAERELNLFKEQVKTALQDIADQIDADTLVAENADKRMFEALAAVDTKLAGLGQAAGFQLESGLWQKIVLKKATPATTPKAQPTKSTAKRGAK